VEFSELYTQVLANLQRHHGIVLDQSSVKAAKPETTASMANEEMQRPFANERLKRNSMASILQPTDSSTQSYSRTL
jgi:hypothetical protein